MQRFAPKTPSDVVFHVLNRGLTRRKIFRKDEDYAAFERAMVQSIKAVPIRVLAYCIMPNHWHLLLWPHQTKDIELFVNRLTATYTRRWQEHYNKLGSGPLYQQSFQSFPVQEDGHFLTVARYIERNPVRGRLVRQAQDWQWSSLHRRYPKEAAPSRVRTDESMKVDLPLTAWPVLAPLNWVYKVNQPLTHAEMDRLRESVVTGRPYGAPAWETKIIERLRLKSSVLPAGRPGNSRDHE